MINTIKINSNISLHYIPMQKLKTTSLGLYIHRDLTAEEASKNGLIPYVLKRGCKLCKDSGEIARYLENLYGASMDAGVLKKGEDQILGFNFESISDKYAPQGEKLLYALTDLLLSVVFEPIVENGGFRAEFVEQEKRNVKDMIQSLVNDKRSYASWRCVEEMCKGEPMGVYKMGTVDGVDAVDEKSLYEHYKRIITSSVIDIFICGDADDAQIAEKIRSYTDKIQFSEAIYPKVDIRGQKGEIKRIRDEMDVTQGKLSIGFRTNIKATEKEYWGLMVANSIFGGGAHSKLFNNVREKLSLAYYASSQLEKFKGLMLVNSGIEFENFEKAYDETLLQLESIKKGEISEKEFQSSISAILNALESYYDNQRYMEDLYLGENILGNKYDIEYMKEQVKKVTVADVVAAANKIELDTVYFLAGKGGK
ncbi:MAG: insulinase family protein [Clostridia bacterium]|nr:insulinase family protein [Clostridia bacterium]